MTHPSANLIFGDSTVFSAQEQKQYEILLSLIQDPEPDNFCFDDFELIFDDLFGRDHTRLQIYTIILTKLMALIAIIYDYYPLIIYSKRPKWKQLFPVFFSLDLSILLIVYNQSHRLSTLISFLDLQHPLNYLYQQKFLHFIDELIPLCTPEQQNEVYSYTEIFLNHFYGKLRINSDGEPHSDNDVYPIRRFTMTFVSFLSHELNPDTPTWRHPFYQRFIQLPEIFLSEVYDVLSTLIKQDPDSYESFQPLLTTLFKSPFFCSRAFKTNNQYFLPFCDIGSAIGSDPDFFV